ncbi:hypothetical protein [Pseudomonas chlororaphis]|uniref:hypothetical protein n=1 Tax=Pseudomonas chlororaphis TaxID=587753 RepID=UPI002367B23C|nr:hypothetical protein [Pseudomonas chlororaphis]WDG50455.1 hypothetical protein PUP58_11935 [Pseudomonas chlororaphis]
MIARTYIERNLKVLTKSFNTAPSTLLTVLYAKLVIVEVGGWIELSMDDLAKRAAKSLKETANTKFRDNIIKTNYGFDYDMNFRQMLMKMIGLVRVEALEKRLDVATHTKMKVALSNLKIVRNQVSHTYVKNISLGTISAPSLTYSYFLDVYNGLLDIEKNMKALRIIA